MSGTFLDFVSTNKSCFCCGKGFETSDYKLVLELVRGAHNTNIVYRLPLEVVDGNFKFILKSTYYANDIELLIEPNTNRMLSSIDTIYDFIKNKKHSFYIECSYCLSVISSEYLAFDDNKNEVRRFKACWDIFHLTEDARKKYNIYYIISDFEKQETLVAFNGFKQFKTKWLDKNNFKDIEEMVERIGILSTFS